MGVLHRGDGTEILKDDLLRKFTRRGETDAILIVAEEKHLQEIVFAQKLWELCREEKGRGICWEMEILTHKAPGAF